MKKIKPFIVLATLLFAVTLIVPAVLVLPFKEGKASGKLGLNLSDRANGKPTQTVNAAPTADSIASVAVYRSSTAKIDNIVLEDYLVGVVAAEMPAEFKEEALKAQALTARTYIVKRMVSGDRSGAPDGAMVTDMVNNQAYKDDAQLRKQWGPEYNVKHQKILDAVRATSGQVLTYKGEVISALFFSTSNGYTENSEDYWSGTLPYLRSVKSPWDKKSPKFSNQVVKSVKEFETMLGVKLGKNEIGEITELTAGKRVAKVNFNGKILTGKEIRERLDLKSSDFRWERKGSNIIITTKGNGHGVGMSQYGANGMAEEGKSYEDIVHYYYKNVEIVSAKNMLETVTARK